MNRLVKRRFLLLLAAGLASIAVAVRYVIVRTPLPQPPEVPLEQADPELAAAIESALAEVRRNPRDPDGWRLLCHRLLANNFLQPAIAALQTTQKLDPNNPAWPFLEGSALVLLSRPAEASPCFERALPLCRGSEQRAAVLFAQFESSLELGRFEEARAAMNSLEGLEGRSPRVHFAAGLLDAALGQDASARDHLLLLVEHPCARKQACALLAGLLPETADSANRYRARSDALPMDRPWPNPFDDAVRNERIVRSDSLEKFQELQAAGQPEEAFEYLRDLAERLPNESVCFALANEFLKRGDFDSAHRSLEQALKFNGNNMKSRMLLGVVQMERGERLFINDNGSAAAKDLFRDGVRQEKLVADNRADSGLSHYTAGRCWLRLGGFEEAKSEFRKAIALSPDFYEAHLALGERLAEEGHRDEGLVHLERAVRLAPADAAGVRKALEKWKAKGNPG